MSFLSDLLEGNFSNLGTDITHAPSSFASHPAEWAETAAAALALTGIGAGLGGALGAGALGAEEAGAGALGADIGAGAADLGAADAAFGAFDPALFAANTADVAAGGLGADIVGGLGADAAAFGTDALAADAFLPDASTLATGSLDFSGPADLTAANEAFGTFDPASFAADTGPSAVTDFGAGPGAIDQLPTGPAGVDVQPANLAAANKAFGTFDPSGFAANTANAGTGGFFSNIANTLGFGGVSGGDLLKLGIGVAPLALTLGMGQPGLPASAQQLQGQANALSAQGQADLAAARAGQLNTGQTAQLATMRQNLNNQWLQTLYNQGVTDPTKDSRWPQIQAVIEQQINTATSQLIQQNITNALAETGQASTALTSIAQMQLNSDQAFTNNLIGATKALGFAAGSGGGAFKVVPA